MSNNLRSRGWVITEHDTQAKSLDYYKKYYEKEKEKIKYIIFALEEATTTGKQHYQGYIYYHEARTFTTIKKIFPKAHLEVQKGTPEQASDYCKKEGDYIEFGELPKAGKRTDMTRLLEFIQQGHTMDDVSQQFPDLYVRNNNFIRREIDRVKFQWFKENDRPQLEVIYLYGTTGEGKTYSVRQAYKDRYFVHNYKHPFDGYQGQDVLVMEEFRSDLPINQMLNYLDHYADITLPARYADKVACYTKVIIISNWEFEKQYYEARQYDPKTYNAFKRRVTHVFTVEEFRKHNNLV